MLKISSGIKELRSFFLSFWPPEKAAGEIVLSATRFNSIRWPTYQNIRCSRPPLATCWILISNPHLRVQELNRKESLIVFSPNLLTITPVELRSVLEDLFQVSFLG